jgi:hypothetical protein
MTSLGLHRLKSRMSEVTARGLNHSARLAHAALGSMHHWTITWRFVGGLGAADWELPPPVE